MCNSKAAQAAAQAANIAAASVLSTFPELQGLNAEQLAGAIAAISRGNPQRGAEIRAHLDRVGQLAGLSAQAQAQANQRTAAQFQEYARQQDQIFDAIAAKEAPETLKQIKAEVPRIVQEKYGIAPDQLVQLFNTNPIMRDARFQLMMLSAAKYEMAREAAARPAPKPLPRVQKPGSGDDIPAVDYSELTVAKQHFNQNPTLRTATEALLARRRAAAGNRGGSHHGV